MRPTSLIVLCAVTLGWAAGATAQPVRIRGTIDTVSEQAMTVTDRSGDRAQVAITPNASVTVIAPITLAAIKPGSYVGTAALPQPDGTLKALEVQVFPERMRGVGEGTQAWDLQPQSTMTNGTVGDVVGTDQRSVTVRYKGQESKVLVAPGTPVVTYEEGSRALLVPGAHVLMTVTRAVDGTLSASRISVGKDGSTPPM